MRFSTILVHCLSIFTYIMNNILSGCIPCRHRRCHFDVSTFSHWWLNCFIVIHKIFDFKWSLRYDNDGIAAALCCRHCSVAAFNGKFLWKIQFSHEHISQYILWHVVVKASWNISHFPALALFFFFIACKWEYQMMV